MLKIRDKDWTIRRQPDRIGIDLRLMGGRDRRGIAQLNQRARRRLRRREVVDWLRGVWR